MRLRTAILSALVSVATVTGAPLCRAATIRVPEDVGTVLAAVDQAVAGDSVLIGPGTWDDTEIRWTVVNGNVGHSQCAAFLKPGLTLIGTSGAEETILDGGEVTTASVQTLLLQNEAPGLVTKLEGLTITGGGNGIIADGAHDVEVKECRFVGNARSGCTAIQGTSISLLNCYVSGNNLSGEAGGTTGGIQFHFNGNRLEARGCVFEACPRGAVYLKDASSALIEDCEFLDIKGSASVYVQGTDDITIRDCRFLRNTSGGGSGITFQSSHGTVSFCVFAHDSATVALGSGYGGAVYAASNSQVGFEYNTFYACYARWGGGAAYLGSSGRDFNNNVVAACTGAAALRKALGPISPGSGCNLLWGNTGGDFSGEWTANATDLFVDPVLCDSLTGDYTVDSTSICLPENNLECGAIGALGQGCTTVSVEPISWGRIKERYREEESQ